MFRALRSKEDPRNGLQPFSRTANVNVADHVENGSHIETQYISMTGRLAVAVYFAARGYHERGHANPRIGVFGASASRMEQFYAEEMVGNNRTAGNFARAFDEYIFTEVEAERYLALHTSSTYAEIIWMSSKETPLSFEIFSPNTTHQIFRR